CLRLRQRYHLRIPLTHGCAVVAQHQVSEFAGQHFVAVHHDVKYGLRSNDLTGRRYKRRIAGVATHCRYFLEYFADSLGRALLPELALHIGDHAAWYLTVEDCRVHTSDVRQELSVARSYRGKIIIDLCQSLLVETGFIASAFQHLDKAFSGIVAGTEA